MLIRNTAAVHGSTDEMLMHNVIQGQKNSHGIGEPPKSRHYQHYCAYNDSTGNVHVIDRNAFNGYQF